MFVAVVDRAHAATAIWCPAEFPKRIDHESHQSVYTPRSHRVSVRPRLTRGGDEPQPHVRARWYAEPDTDMRGARARADEICARFRLNSRSRRPAVPLRVNVSCGAADDGDGCDPKYQRPARGGDAPHVVRSRQSVSV